MEKEIEYYLDKVNRIKPLNTLLEEPIVQADTIEYYTSLNKFYRGLHSKEGAIHAPLYIVKGEKRHGEALYEQADYVHDYMQGKGAQRVLELGCGTGYNSRYLAPKNPDTEFVGLDLTPLHIKKAKAETQSIKNLDFVEGDFQSLPFESNSFDLAFAVETICHAKDLTAVTNEIYRVLKPGGTFIIFDGYGRPKLEQASKTIQNAALLIAYGFAIENPQLESDFMKATTESGLKMEEQIDFSVAVLPNCLVYQKSVKKIFWSPMFTRFLLFIGILNRPLFRHAVAGLFIPFLLENGYSAYYRMTFKK